MIVPNACDVARQLETIESWAGHLDDLARSIAPRLPRFEAWQRARDYLKGLLSNVERKNGWQLSEHLGEVNP